MGENLKNIAKKVIKRFSKKILLICTVVCTIVMLLAGCVYFITIDDGTYKDGDWSSVPYAAGQYTSTITFDGNNGISTSMTAQELWDKMLENDSRVNVYLDKPEELKKLMNAEVVTKFLDTRENPDEHINWDSDELTDVNSKKIQGIAKLKRSDSDNNKYTMSYVDEATFQSYIDEYNASGSDEAKQNALKHFTLVKTKGVQHCRYYNWFRFI